MFKHRLTPQQALPKIRHFCAYQERCHKEVKEKLYSFGLNKQDVETLISNLVEDDYLNEERFVQQYVGGKFRSKQWGKTKIVYELKQKGIGQYLINKAFKEIEEGDYHTTLLQLAQKKWDSLKSEQYINRQVKTQHYLQQKGYELPLIQKALLQVRGKESNHD